LPTKKNYIKGEKMIYNKTTLEISTELLEKLMKFIDELNEVEKIFFIQYYLTDTVKDVVIDKMAERKEET